METIVTSRRPFHFFLGMLVLLGLYLTSFYNYLLFHSLAEIFSIVIACGIFMIAWNARRFIDNNYLLFIGVAYLFVGGIDLIHTLAYKGMGVFPGHGTNLSTQLWIAGRYMESLSLLIAPLWLRRKFKTNLVLTGYTAAAFLLLASIFYWEIFPVCFIEGRGLTPFKKISEYIISLILLASGILLLKNRNAFDRNVLRWILWSILLTISSELAFTFYIHAYGFSNLVGHYLKIVSFYFMYKALIETGLARPYHLLFRNMKQSEEALQTALHESKQRETEIAALLEGSRAVLNYREFKDSAQSIFNSCKNLIGASAGYISLLSKDGKENEVAFLEPGSLPCTVDPNLPMPIRGLREAAYRAGKTIFHNDFSKSEYTQFMPEGHAPLDNVLFAPLTLSRKVIGLLGIANKPGGFNENDARIASAFGELAAIALYNSRALESLETNEERFRSVVQTANDAIVSVDRGGNIVFWNHSAETVFGYANNEAIGKPLSFMMPERFREAHQNGMDRFLETGKANLFGKTVEMVGLRKDGSEFPIELSLAMWETKEGTFFTGIIRDITERKQAEEALRKAHDVLEQRVRERTEELSKAYQKSEEQSRILEAFFRYHLAPFVILDKDFYFVRVNEAYARACQKDVSEFPGRNHFEFYPHEENEAIFQRVVETREPFQAFAKPFSFPDHPEWGSTYWNWTLTPILWDTGEVGFLVLSLEDVTQRKAIQKRIEATNALLNLFVKMPSRKDYLDAALELVQNWSGCRCAGVRVLDDHGSIPYESYVGFSQEFWESENLLSLKNDQCACIRAITGEVDPQDAPVVTPAGSFCCGNTIRFIQQLSDEEKKRYRGGCVENGFLSLGIIPIRYGEKILGAIHLADETEGKLTFKTIEFIESMAPLIGEAVNRFTLEEALRQSEKRLRMLSSQLLTVQEVERKRIAREIHDSIGQTLAAIKFGLENKLSHMGGDAAPPGVSIEDIISLTQNGIEESRRIQMDLRPSVLDDLGILATVGWFTREFQKVYSNISIEKEIYVHEEEVPDALKTALFRVMQEAMNNVAKHSKAGRVRLILRKMGDRIELSVEDNGAGFDPENIKEGLGLTSMRERAELLGGTFEIESAPGKGTVIRGSWTL